MATNKYRNPAKPADEPARPSLFALMQKVLRVDSVFESGLPIRYIPRLLFITGLALFYIGNNHYARKNIVNLQKMQAEIEELRVAYITTKSGYMTESKQSSVAQKVAAFQLEESQTPAKKIVLEDE